MGKNLSYFDQALVALKENNRFIERHDREKNGSSEALFGEVSRQRTTDKGY